MKRVGVVVVGLAAVLLLGGCSFIPTGKVAGASSSTPGVTDTAGHVVPDAWRELSGDGQALTCVRVLAPSEFATGLSGSKAPQYGAVFVFRPGQVQAFWMRHTAGPLILFWLDRAGRVQGRVPMAAESLVAHSPPPAATWAVELPPALAPSRVPAVLTLGASCVGI